MLRNNSVIFKGRRDGITILLDDETEYEEIRRVLTEKLVGAEKFFGDAATSISFKGRTLTDEQESELLSIVSSKTRLDIKFFDGSGTEDEAVMHRPHPAVKEKSALESIRRGQMEDALKSAQIAGLGDNPPVSEMMTYFCRSSLRSGQSIRYNGSVVVMGDVNPGAEIFAAGNIIVFGTLKGLVHAGCKGNKDAYVSALCLQPVQLRISDIYTYIPLETIKDRKRIQPAHAFIEGGKIFIQPFAE